MTRLWSVLLLVFCISALISCGDPARSSPGVDVSGKWNATFTENGNAIPSYAVGLSFTKDTTVISGTEVPYTGGTQYNTGCVNYGGWTATGNTANGGSTITLSVHDPSTTSGFTISGQANGTVSEIDGTFQATFGANGSNPACPSTTGTVVFTRQ
jgi:hypothetical protein